MKKLHKYDEITEEILDRISAGYCAVLGAGVSNLPLIDILTRQNARVCVRDKKTLDEMKNGGLVVSRADAVIGGDRYLEGLDTFTPPGKTVIFRSPGLRHDAPEINKAVERGAILSSEMELFFRLTRSSIIAVTGSDGKTTTTTLIGKLLQRGQNTGRVYIGGNIGKPLLPESAEMSEDDYAVVELSSFQLQTMRTPAHTAVITNITPNHLNWHKDMDEYTEAKYNVFLGDGCEHLIVSADNELSLRAAFIARKKDKDIRLTLFSINHDSYESVVPQELIAENTDAVYERDGVIIHCVKGAECEVMRRSDIKLPGRHNVLNYMAAIAATAGTVSYDTVRELASEFGGVEHRIELVREKDGIKYYNSSIDSTPTRTEAALSAFSEKVIVICGGRNKNLSFDGLAETLCKRAKAAVLTGESADEIMSAIENYGGAASSELRVEVCRGFKDAVIMASRLAQKGDTVILSPACTSFDAFDNFEERGNAFKDIVKSL